MQSEQFQLHAEIEERHWWFVARRRILRELVGAIAPVPAINHAVPKPPVLPGDDWRVSDQAALKPQVKPGANEQPVIVDIGCGTGGNLAAFAGDYRCVGIDTSAEAIELARKRFPGITFVCGQAPQDVAQWLAEASVALLTDVLEHVADDRGLLASIVEACPPGAQLLVTVPADMRLWSPHDEVFGHYRRYDAEGLAAVWSRLPVKPRLVSHFNSRLYPAVRTVRYFNQRRGRAGGAANTDFHLPTRPVNAVLNLIFAGESNRLLKAIDRQRPAFQHGVSLVAILQRTKSLVPETDFEGDSPLPVNETLQEIFS